MQNPPGMYITIAIGIILIIAVFLPDMIGKKKKADELTDEADAVKNEIDSATEENERLKAELAELRAEMQNKKSE